MSDHRVEIRFEHRFSRQSNNGKAFGWLKDNLGSASDDAITNAVRFVYLPVALASAGASVQDVEAEVKRAREFLNEKMMAALGSCCEPKSNGSASSNGSTPAPSRRVNLSDVPLTRKDAPHSSNGESTSKLTASELGAANLSTPKIEPLDDFLELDEDKLMEGF